MKKLLMSLATFVLVMSNCSNEEIENVITTQGKTAIKAVMEEPVISRATVDATSGNITWTNGDKMNVYTTATESPLKEFIYNVTTEEFECEEDVTVKNYAIYPSTITYANNKVTLPASYELGATTDNVNAIMLASGFEEGAKSFSLKHLGGVIRFTIKKVPAGSNKLVFTSNKKITGEFTIKNEKITVSSKTATVNNTVTLNFDATTEVRDMDFYVPVPTGTIKMKSIELYNGNSLLMTKTGTKNNTIARAGLILMPIVDCEVSIIQDALNGDSKTFTLTEDITSMTGVTIPAGATLDGGNKTLTMDLSESSTTISAALRPAGGTIKNLTIDGNNATNANGKANRAIYITNPTENVTIENVTIKNSAYAISTGDNFAANLTLTVTQSHLEGWTSYAKFASVFFTNCTFAIGTYYSGSENALFNGGIRPYITTTFENCTFEKGFYLDFSCLHDGSTITFKNCKIAISDTENIDLEKDTDKLNWIYKDPTNESSITVTKN